MKQLIAVYPGTFDPMTIGHADIIARSLSFVDKLIIAIAHSSTKGPLFAIKERLDMAHRTLEHLELDQTKIQVKTLDGLLVDFATKEGASIIIRGLRAISDFEYELQMSCMNSKLEPRVETIFLPASGEKHFISSSFVREICRLGGDISQFVTPYVAEQLEAYFHKKS